MLFRSGTTKAVEGLKAFEPVAFFWASVRLLVLSAVIGEGKEVLLARESDMVDQAHQVRVYELVSLLGSLLLLSIVDLCDLGSLAAVADVAFWIIYITDS